MAITLTFANQKGGVGKTTISCFLSQFYAFIKDMPTLLIDTEPQGNATRTILGPQKTQCATLMDVIMNEKSPFDVIQETKIKNLHILPSFGNSMYTLEHFLGAQADGALKIRDVLDDYMLRDKYPMIIFDTPPSLLTFTINALIASEYVVVPVENEIYAADAYREIKKTLDMTKKKFNPALTLLGAVINKFDSRSALRQSIIESYEKDLGNLLFTTKLHRNIAIGECIFHTENLFTYDKKAPITKDFAQLGEEILRRVEESRQPIREAVAI